MLSETDRLYLKRCIELAETALQKGDAPFGSILVSGEGEILFEDHNRISGGDHTRHPEFAIARWATQHLNPDARQKATVYTSGEHCSMCASAHGLVGLGRIVYASSTEQLTQWKKKWGIESGPLKVLSIKDVIRHADVDGPDEKLSKEVKNLQLSYHKQDK